jgi:hypothetical protein
MNKREETSQHPGFRVLEDNRRHQGKKTGGHCDEHPFSRGKEKNKTRNILECGARPAGAGAARAWLSSDG